MVHGSGGGAEAQGDVGDHPPKLRMPLLPFKLNQDRRHHIPRQQRKVTNWPAYDASLRQRGSLTVWFTDEAIAGWTAEPRTTRGGHVNRRAKRTPYWPPNGTPVWSGLCCCPRRRGAPGSKQRSHLFSTSG